MIEMWRRNKSSVTLELAIDGPIDTLDETTKLTVYRIVQEGLTNAFRHSGAAIIAVDVSLQRDDAVKVSVRDNGRGRADSSAEGFGLKGMRERVNALSGSFALSSTADGGTFLQIRLPAATTGPTERETPRPGDLLQGE
jgi:two-component system sensor histidine kinase UhpB